MLVFLQRHLSIGLAQHEQEGKNFNKCLPNLMCTY